MLSRSEITALIPHSGAMVLLDRMLESTPRSILCLASSHCDPDNPLRYQGILGIVCGIEYAAQAMALHGGLLRKIGAKPHLGFLASVRSLVFQVQRLDDCCGDLLIEANQIAAMGANMLYGFSLHCQGRELMSGRAAVVLDAAL